MNEQDWRHGAAPRRTPTDRPVDLVDATEEVADDTLAPQPPALWGRRSHPAAPSASPYAPYGMARYEEQPAEQPAEQEWTEAHVLALPFPLWLTLGAPLALALTLALVFVVETQLLGGDWATGALAVSFTAIALALVTVGVLIGRVALGRRTFGAVALGGLLALALVTSGAGGIAQANPLRQAQARQAEAAHNWQFAVEEYTQAGARPPHSTDLARVYTEWGEASLQQGDYATATAKLTTVVKKYDSSGDLAARARADLFKTYSQWITSGAITLPFKQSLDFLAAYASDPACDATCQQSIINLTAQAHYQYGQQLAQAGQFKPAIAEFDLIASQYATSSFAASAHTADAAATWALGQQLLTQDCVSAIPYYQTLAAHYSDTPQGKQAKTALAAPQTVTGALTKFPTSPAPTIYLSTYINPATDTYSHDYKATFDTKTGIFTFTKVTPGDYHLTTDRSTSSYEYYTWYKSNGQPEIITVEPLCATQVPSRDY